VMTNTLRPYPKERERIRTEHPASFKTEPVFLKTRLKKAFPIQEGLFYCPQNQPTKGRSTMTHNPLLPFLSDQAKDHYKNTSMNDMLTRYATDPVIEGHDKYILGSLHEAVRQYRPKPAMDEITASASAKRFAQAILTNDDQEEFLVVALDIKHRILGYDILYRGTLNSSVVHPRDVARFILQYPTARFMIAHNHPSGETRASKQDVAVSHRLDEMGDLLGIALLDHIVVANGGGALSMKEEGVL